MAAALPAALQLALSCHPSCRPVWHSLRRVPRFLPLLQVDQLAAEVSQLRNVNSASVVQSEERLRALQAQQICRHLLREIL